MTPVQKVSLGLLEVIESVLLEAEARQVVLKHLQLEGDNYLELIETAKILRADKVHQVVEQLRDVIRSTPEPHDLPQDVSSVVQRILEQLP